MTMHIEIWIALRLLKIECQQRKFTSSMVLLRIVTVLRWGVGQYSDWFSTEFEYYYNDNSIWNSCVIFGWTVFVCAHRMSGHLVFIVQLQFSLACKHKIQSKSIMLQSTESVRLNAQSVQWIWWLRLWLNMKMVDRLFSNRFAATEQLLIISAAMEFNEFIEMVSFVVINFTHTQT